jgi:hypothetical protein
MVGAAYATLMVVWRSSRESGHTIGRSPQHLRLTMEVSVNHVDDQLHLLRPRRVNLLVSGLGSS